ncbi:MAG: ATP-dependent RecD-like DNA helicase [Deltaproteobacteria bacterium]|nr:ATP-dependent RecD-like DNA helicase [Deltaproteobacteria bacterium]
MNSKTLITLEGSIERISFYNEENHFTIARLKIKGEKDTIPIIGQLFSVTPGEVLKISGYFEQHPKYGRQIRIESYESLIPATLPGIEKYLGSGLVRGIGPEMAKRIVKRFGLSTLEIIEQDIRQLSKVEGVGPKRIAQIKEAWKEQKEIRRIMIFLQGYGVSTGLATKIFKTYGQQAVARIQENPYGLAADIFGVGFLTADRIAQKMGMEKDAPARLQAGLTYILQQKSEEGQVCLPEEELMAETSRQLEVDPDQLQPVLKTLVQKKQLRTRQGETGRVYIFLPYLDLSEEGISQRMGILLQNKPKIDGRTEAIIARVEKTFRLTLSGQQKEAVRKALSQKLLIITGGPGTGKTTIVRSILEIFKQLDRKCILMAPTGRAAKRLSEVTHYPATTIHRGLGYNPKMGGFQKDEGHPLPADLVVIDEASMVDTYLMFNLLRAVPDQAVLILVGDVFQLPSVGPGNVLSDFIQSEKVPVVQLNRIFRQGEGSLIVVNAHRIHQGDLPILAKEDGNREQDFYFLEQEEPEKAARWILELVQDKLPKRYGLDPLQDIQVLTPMYKGVVGAENLNLFLQQHLNKDPRSVQRGTRLFKVGDKVMQLRNNYDKDVFNGDIGRLAKIDQENQEVLVNFDGRFVVYDFAELDDLVLAYAISVHKSQGNEYPAVILPVMIQHFILLQRNLIYTAVTRAKKVVVLVGTKKALAIGIKNNKPQLRYSFLKERLIRLP